jgi:hypothetical protein
MSRARLPCSFACALLVDLALAGGCATAPEPAPAARPAPPPVSAAAAAAVPDGGTGPVAPAPSPPAPVASAGPPAPAGPGHGDGRPNLEMKEVSERAWLAALRKKLGEKLGADPAEFRLSPRKQLVAFVRSPSAPPVPAAALAKKKGHRPPPPPPPRKHLILVADLEGKVQATFHPVVARGSDEPPHDLRFLSETSIIYEVIKPPPPPVVARPSGHPHHSGSAKHPGPPPAPPPPPVPPLSEQRLFVIQPLGKRPRTLRCEGWAFSWNPGKDHLAYVTGAAGKTSVSVDGVKMYPRKSQTIIGSDPAWSKDGTSLAFLELRPGKPVRLVLLAEFDNPTGDTIWELPATVPTEGAQVFWANHGKLVVGKSVLKPVFATPFVKEPPIKFDP